MAIPGLLKKKILIADSNRHLACLKFSKGWAWQRCPNLNFSKMSKIVDRYEKLRLGEYQSRNYYYPFVCKEISLILRSAYTKVPKNLQSLLFQDTLAAFRFLPLVETRSGMEAANLLLQAAEFALPKHKRVMAAKEFKHAVVAYKRHHKAKKDIKGSASLPQDVLIHVFSFLDAHSLVAVASVCWSWNSAASENRLWRCQYETLFGCPGKDLINVSWREAFKQAYIGNSWRRFASNRGYCCICKSVIWVSNMKCPNMHHGVNQRVKPVSPQQLVEYLVEGTLSLGLISDSESDSDEEPPFKLWAHTRRFSF